MMEASMKRILIALMIAGFVVATAPALWAQGEPNPPRSDVKAPKSKTDGQKSDTKK
jgi:hypothetical protein